MSDSTPLLPESRDLLYSTNMDIQRPGLQALERTSRHMLLSKSEMTEDGEAEAEGDHSDSGVFNSSKNTAGSMSDTELTDDSENRPGVIEYCPDPADIKKSYTSKPYQHLQHQNDRAYDGSIHAEDAALPVNAYQPIEDDYELKEVVVKRHDGDTLFSRYGTEMTVFHTNEEQNRRTKEENSAAYDEAVPLEDDDDDEADLSSVTVRNNYPRYGPRDMDEVEFHGSQTRISKITSPYSSEISLTLDRPDKEVDRGIRFPLQKFTSTYPKPNNMISGIGQVANLAEESGSDERNPSSLSDTASKKRRKKKKSGKDEGGGELKDSYDVNGNPVDLSQHEKQHIPQNDTAIASSSDPISEKKRKKNKKTEKIVKAEEIPGHCGNSELDDLIDYINNDGKKKKQLPVTNGPCSVLDKDKNTLKKSKKSKSNGSKEGSEKASSENGSEKSKERINTDFSDEKIKDSISDSMSDLKDDEGLAQTSSLDEPNLQTSSISSLQHDVYYFTDFENVARVEEEFQVVGKQKKKKRSGPSASHGSSYREPSLDFNREDRSRSRRPLRSVTPPPTPTASQEKPNERAFSPSAFPVLSGRPREGRRNSTGNATFESNLDDSDMESVKSLPLVAGSSSTSTKTSGTTSPGSGRPQGISYAKMVAKPASKQSSSGANSVTASVSAAGVAVDRRHSLDSNPHHAATLGQPSSEILAVSLSQFACNDGPGVSLSQNVTNFTEEPFVINAEGSPSSARTSSLTIHLGENSNVNITSSKSVGEYETETGNSRIRSISLSKPNHSSPPLSGTKPDTAEPSSVVKLDLEMDFPHISKNVSANNKHKPGSLPQRTSKNSVTNKKLVATSSNEVHQSSGDVSKSDKTYKDTTASNMSNAISSRDCKPGTSGTTTSVRGGIDSKVVTLKPPTLPNVTNNHKKIKPVYFLDNKLNKAPKDLGISFGFDHLLPDATVQLSEPSGTLLAEGTTTNSDNSIQGLPTGKVKEGLAKLNGLIISHASSTSSSQQERRGKTTTHLTAASSASCMQHAWNTSMPYVPPAPEIGMPQFGDVKLSQLTPSKRPPSPSKDPNFDRGKFNVEDIVLFLKKEWNNIMDIKDRNPQRVICYSTEL